MRPSLALGALGMPGFTAYVGLLDIGQPRAGETVVVAAATGAVGAMVGQIARLRGARVIGIAGGADKCRHAVDTLRFDACLDRREPDLAARLAEACLEGIDVYFENVGGDVLAAVLPLLNVGARIRYADLSRTTTRRSRHSDRTGRRSCLPPCCKSACVCRASSSSTTTPPATPISCVT